MNPVAEMQRLGDEIELAYGHSLPAHSRNDGDIPVFGSNGRVGSHNAASVSGPGIVIGRKGSVGEVNFSIGDFWPIDTTYYVVNKKNHNWDYLYYLLRFLDFTDLNSHSAVPGLNREDAYALSAWFPDNQTQENIAKALRQFETSIKINEQLIRHCLELKASAMHSLFSRGLRGEPQRDSEVGPVPQGWLDAAINDHFAISSGGTPARGNPAFWTGGTIPWVKTGEVNYSVITETSEHITQAGLESSAAKLLPAGTLLMAMYGQGVTRGKVALLGIEATCNQACAAMQPKDNAIQAKYLYHFLTYRYEAIRQLAHGGQQQNLNLDIVGDLVVTYPKDQDEQAEIVAILDAIDQKIDLHKRKRAVLEELFRSLLHKLMTGEVRVADLDLSALVGASRTQEGGQ